MKPPHRIPVIHRIERRYLIHPHWRHLQDLSHLVHDADTGEAVLPLAEIEEGHHGGFFVLRGVAFQDFGDEFLVYGIELEGDGGVVLRGIAVLKKWGSGQIARESIEG